VVAPRDVAVEEIGDRGDDEQGERATERAKEIALPAAGEG